MNSIADFQLPQTLVDNINKITKYGIDYSTYSVEERIEIMENIMFREQDQHTLRNSIPLVHFVQGDIYFRGIWFPAGTILTSNIHLVKHLGYMVQGSALVLTNYEELHKVVAPNMYICSPGTKRLILTLEDCIWCTVHNVEELTPEEREDVNLMDKFTRANDVSWANSLIEYSLKDSLNMEDSL
jgi:hypothetical protein